MRVVTGDKPKGFIGTFDALYWDLWSPAKQDELACQVRIGNHRFAYKLTQCRPILRRLEDMTEEEAFEYGETFAFWNGGTSEEYRRKRAFLAKDHAKQGRYHTTALLHLLSKSFDLFGLCDSGLALDSKTLNQ